MKSCLKKIVFFLVLVLIGQPCFGEDLLHDTLKNGFGITAFGMGSAYTGYAAGADSIFYNPAGTVIPGVMYNYLNCDYNQKVYSAFNGYSFYVSPFNFGYWQKENAQAQKVEVTAFSLARRSQNGINWGVTYKSIQETTNQTTTSTWSSDFGLLVHFTPWLNFGLNLQDILGSNTSLTPSGRLGFAMATQKRDFILTTDLVYKKGDTASILETRHGLQYRLTPGITVRGGFKGPRLTGGLSIALPIVDVNYAYQAAYGSEGAVYMLGFKLGKGLVTQNRQRYALLKKKEFVEFSIDQNLISGKSQVTLFNGQKIGSNDLLAILDKVNRDPSSKGYVVRINSLNSSLATIALVQEIRSELEKARQNGKTVIAYIESWASLPEYYLASVADKIIMPELGTISHLGLKTEILKSEDF
ncbi:hypothetical protein HOG75_02520, partial [bacterium]|nr:hypothetical protein [bacterium]